MPEPCIVAVGSSSIGATGLTGRDLFTAAFTEAFDGLPVSLSIREPGPVEREVARDHEAEWPIHVFELE